ncbi:MAG TPA: DUF167 domain-containing protein [Rubrivivax sp.]|nr:DUF167 domain-containing protein [Rubrivivax sp.]HPO19724.1 DUF167 domain-containing protein [Rubrivivax sp.]
MKRVTPTPASATRRLIEVTVKPRAHSSTLSRSDDGCWLAQLKAAPVDGQANAELIALVAKHFGCAKSAVRIKSGATARRKLVQIDGAG